MLKFPAGTHEVPQAGLRYILREPLRLPRRSCLFLRGDNGAGKTTFLEHIFIAHIRSTHSLLYLAQDMELQENTMRATLALLNISAPPALPELAVAWILASNCRDTLILDEFDKYLDAELFEKIRLEDFGWVIGVSHLDPPPPYKRLAHGFALHFEKQDTEVLLRSEKLW
jgi:hypothetical protein